MSKILDLISNIGAKESALLEQTFVSPVYLNTSVATHIGGMVYTFTIPSEASGWCRIKPKDSKTAIVTGKANLSEREEYLKKLNKIRLVIAIKKEGIFYGLPDKANKYGFKVDELLPIFLCDDSVMCFDRIIARYDGANIWFDQVDQGNDPSKSEYLRHCEAKIMIANGPITPDKLVCSGLTLEEKLAFTFSVSYIKSIKKLTEKDFLRKDVEFAGGAFINFSEKSDHYSVTYKVSGNQYTSYVSKDPVHSVISAGLCLNGNDTKFDLKSLVTVIKEGHQRGLIHNYHLRA